jgi:hypothetical protein
MDRWQYNGESPQAGTVDDFGFNSSGGGNNTNNATNNSNNNMPMGINNVSSNFTWEMIGLGLEEPLPTQETIDELHQIYFEKVHPSVPMIHKYRYLAAMNLYVIYCRGWFNFSLKKCRWLTKLIGPQINDHRLLCDTPSGPLRAPSRISIPTSRSFSISERESMWRQITLRATAST